MLLASFYSFVFRYFHTYFTPFIRRVLVRRSYVETIHTGESYSHDKNERNVVLLLATSCRKQQNSRLRLQGPANFHRCQRLLGASAIVILDLFALG